MKLQTRLVNPPPIPGEPTGAVSTPIYQTATFAQATSTQAGKYDYTRSGNPTRDTLQAQLALVDNAARAFAFNSGMAAIDAVLRLLEAGGEVLTGTDLYGGTNRILAHAAKAAGLSVVHVDTTNPQAVAAALSGRTRLLLLESPTNPRLHVIDLKALIAQAHDAGALVAVDNSLLSAYIQKPLDLGADIAVQSATKALGGHSDLTAGVVSVKDDDLASRLAFIQNAYGSGLAPFDSWLLLRGLETLALRVERQLASTPTILGVLAEHPAVKRVRYPGSESDRERQIQLAQASSCGSIVSFETGSVEASQRIIDAAQLFRTAVSWGGVASSISLPCAMSHAAIPAHIRAERDLPEDIVRISVGAEDPDDLATDLRQALDKA